MGISIPVMNGLGLCQGLSEQTLEPEQQAKWLSVDHRVAICPSRATYGSRARLKAVFRCALEARLARFELLPHNPSPVCDQRPVSLRENEKA